MGCVHVMIKMLCSFLRCLNYLGPLVENRGRPDWSNFFVLTTVRVSCFCHINMSKVKIKYTERIVFVYPYPIPFCLQFLCLVSCLPLMPPLYF